MAIDDNASYELTGYQVKDLAQKIRAKADSSSLASVATSGLYSDLTGAPTIPTVYNGTLTIQQNGTTLGTFSANQSTNETINIAGGGSNKLTLYIDYGTQTIPQYGQLSWFKSFYMTPRESLVGMNLHAESPQGPTLTWGDLSQIETEYDEVEIIFTDANEVPVTSGILTKDGTVYSVTATFPLYSQNNGASLYGITLDGVFSGVAQSSSQPVTLSCTTKKNATPFPMYVLGFDYMNWSQYPSQFGPITMSMLYFDAESAYNMSSYGQYGAHLGQYLPDILIECFRAGGTVLFYTSGDMQTRTLMPNMFQASCHLDALQAAAPGGSYLYPVIEIRQMTGSYRRAIISFNQTGVNSIQFLN